MEFRDLLGNYRLVSLILFVGKVLKIVVGDGVGSCLVS